MMHYQETESIAGRILFAGEMAGVPPSVLGQLARAGYRIESVTDGLAATAALRAGRADAAVIDTAMRGLDSGRFITEARELGIPMILFSAHTGVRQAVEAMKQGAADFLQQPLQGGELLKSLRSALAGPAPAGTSETDGVNEHAAKLETLGRVTAAVAHDLNNQMTILLGYSELLLEQADSSVREGLEEMRRAAWRSAGLARQLLAFSRRQPVDVKGVDLHATVQGMTQMLHMIAGEKVSVELQLDAAPSGILADARQVELALMNLVLNARDAMSGAGRLRVSTANVILDNPGDTEAYVLLRVSDTGTGMDEATQARLFEPFFTTKGPGKGTGLGLSIIKQALDECGGRIDVASRPGEGTTFSLYFPHAPLGKNFDTGLDYVDFTGAHGVETVLLAEDNEAVRSMIVALLDRLGYAVLPASNGRQVADILRQYDGPIHLFLSDVVMPDIDGPVLAQQVADRHPEVRVLFISGYAQPTLAHHTVPSVPVQFLQKPFSTEVLGEKIRETLAQGVMALQ
jgi:signal transduction histidine kinase